MFIRAYLRASTDEQDAGRARTSLEKFAGEQNKVIACEYLENASGAGADRPELLRLLKDARKGDVMLVESIDRLSRLPTESRFTEIAGDLAHNIMTILNPFAPTQHP